MNYELRRRPDDMDWFSEIVKYELDLLDLPDNISIINNDNGGIPGVCKKEGNKILFLIDNDFISTCNGYSLIGVNYLDGAYKEDVNMCIHRLLASLEFQEGSQNHEVLQAYYDELGWSSYDEEREDLKKYLLKYRNNAEHSANWRIEK